MTFKPIVLAVNPERELRWLGRFIVPGLVDGEHSLRIEPLADGRSRFTQTERFSGLLVRPLKSMLGKTELGFEQMNAALKTTAESSRVPPAAALCGPCWGLGEVSVPFLAGRARHAARLIRRAIGGLSRRGACWCLQQR
jgi:hypothetical protein